MGKTITIEDDVYNLLVSLKEGTGDSFSKVLRRHVYRPLETAGEILDAHQNLPAPKIDESLMRAFVAGRGRRSGGRK